MNTDDFEKRLQQQTLRQIPGEWRAEILRKATGSRPSTPDPRPSFLACLLWLRPGPWAALGAIWAVIFALHFASRDNAPQMAKDSKTSAPEMMLTLKEEQQLLAELIGNSEPNEMERPKRLPPQPHTERRRTTAMA
jgi:hypothetical protein